MSASIKMSIHFASGKCGHRILRKGRKPKHAKPTRLPRVTRLMALSIKYEYLILRGLVKNHDELADLAGVDRSLVSRIIRLRLLAPEIQEWILNLPEQEKGNDPVGMIELRSISTTPSWEKQRDQLHSLIPHQFPLSTLEAPAMPPTRLINNGQTTKEKYHDN